MQLTDSHKRVFRKDLLDRYVFAEVRNAAATLFGTNPDAFNQIISVLSEFWLTLDDLTDPGKNKSNMAAGLDLAFRKLGWREASHTSKTLFALKFSPYPTGTAAQAPIEFGYESSGHKVDNFLARIALDVEWNAKDGNLDRDLANFRALHEVGVIDVGVLITRHQERTKWAANRLAELGGKIRYTADKKRIILLGTTTTTNLEKLLPRLERGDAGGCPVLAIAITELSYKSGDGDPKLPQFSAAEAAAAVPDPDKDATVVAAAPEDGEGLDA